MSYLRHSLLYKPILTGIGICICSGRQAFLKIDLIFMKVFVERTCSKGLKYQYMSNSQLPLPNCKTTQILKVQSKCQSPTLPQCAAQSEETTPLKNRGTSSIKIGDGGRLNKQTRWSQKKIPKQMVSKYIGRLNT